MGNFSFKFPKINVVGFVFSLNIKYRVFKQLFDYERYAVHRNLKILQRVDRR